MFVKRPSTASYRASKCASSSDVRSSLLVRGRVAVGVHGDGQRGTAGIDHAVSAVLSGLAQGRCTTTGSSRRGGSGKSCEVAVRSRYAHPVP